MKITTQYHHVQILALGALLACLELPGYGANTVTTLNDSGPGSLRQAIADAAPGDTIDFAVTGTITLTSGQLVIAEDLTISGPGATDLTVRQSGVLSRIFKITGGNVSFSGLRIADGDPVATGGGILIEAAATVDLSDCVIASNKGNGGAGIRNDGTLTVANCTITNNSNFALGGAGILNTGTLIVSNSLIARNLTSSTGGGIANTGNLTLHSSLVLSNTASAGGGGIDVRSGTVDVTQSSVIGNYGGGIDNHGSLLLTSSTLAANSGSGLASGGHCRATNTTFSGNSSGEIIHSNSSLVSLHLQSCTIFPNGLLAPLYANDPVVTLRVGNSLIEMGSGYFLSEDYNLIHKSDLFTITGVTTHNIYGKDPLLGLLADNGGPTPTHALLPGSPAIDQGSSGGLATDQRGQVRPVDFAHITNSDAGDGTDIGAFEVRDLPQTGPVFTVNSTDDVNDGLAGLRHCSLREAITFAAPGDAIDFGVAGTITLTSGELVITNDLIITGPGPANLTVSGNNASRVFLITAGGVSLSGMSIANGRLVAPPTYQHGAGIYNLGTLSLSNCWVFGNTNTTIERGGGLQNEGHLTVVDSIISRNLAATGGGLANTGHGSASILNSTLSDNVATVLYGGGIANDGIATVSATNTTLSGNSAARAGGGIADFHGCILESCTITRNTAGVSGDYSGGGIYGTPSLYNTIVAANTAPRSPDLTGCTSLGFILIGNTNGATITGVTAQNIYGKDPLLGPLADNGGPTPTHALLPGSPAIDHGSSGDLTTDQRGLPRSFNFPLYYDADDASDIGAVEMQEGPQLGLVFTVNSTDDVDDGVPGIAHCSLREAINAANANLDTNTIAFAGEIPGVHAGVTGTITLTNGQLTITNSVNINGPGAANLTVSGHNTNRVFDLPAFNSVKILGLTIANGKPNLDGGGIRSINAVLTVSECTISNCSASVGGGIRNQFGTVLVENCLLTGNSGGSGAKSGGGIFNDRGTVTIRDSILSRNAGDVGGAIWNYIPPSAVVICNSLVSSNTALNGGAIRNEGTLTATNSTFCGNTANVGAGIHNYYTAAASSSPTAFLDTCTVTRNSATQIGGGVANDSVPPKPRGTTTIRNSILAGNTCPFGPDVFSKLNSLDYNLIQDTNGASISGLTDRNIYNQDPKLGPLADLGGPTPTHALRFDSPALDAGHSGGLTTDQRGLPRPIDDPTTPNAEGGDGSDIGAYEADPNLRLTGITSKGSDIWLSFSSLFGRNYALEWADSLPGAWQVLTNNVSGTGSPLQALDAGGATQPRRFYRAVQLP